jgi:FG-GAP-like repeat
MNARIRCLITIVLSLSFLCLVLEHGVVAQTGDFNLEAEQNWDTYGVGGTCIYGTQNIFVGDVDGDSVMEIVTGGFAYNTSNGSRTFSEAPLKVWTWNGQNVTLKASASWIGNILCLYAADVDNDKSIEILTAGACRNETGNYTTSCIRVWRLDHQELSLKAHFEGTSVNSIFVGDIDRDGTSEIVTVGRLRKNSMNTGQLCLWHFEGNALSLVGRTELDAANVTNANSVFASDLDNNGNMEIIVGGYSDNLNNSKGQLSLWQWNGNEFSLRANENWQLVPGIYAETIAGAVQGNTIVNNAKAADLDGDGLKEIVAGGFAFDGENVKAQLGIWRWDGNVLARLDSQEWATDYLTEIKSVSLSDVDNDGKTEAVTSGITAAENSFKNSEALNDRGQLRVWGFNGTALNLKQNAVWTFDEGACAWNVGNGDVDKDGVLEIITVGCTALGSLCDPDMRVWSITNASTTPSFSAYTLAAIALVGIASLSVIAFVWQKKRKVNAN